MDQEIYSKIDQLTAAVLSEERNTTSEEGLWLLELPADYLSWLMAGADRIKKHFLGDEIEVCAIANVRSGNCSENCGFCAQSGHYKTPAQPYPYISAESLADKAQAARQWGVSDFGMVSKGWGIRTDKERKQLREYLQTLSDLSDIGRCASLGVLTEQTAQELNDMGLENYHHNLETARSFFDQVCTTHTYQENIDTVRHAVNAGLRVCSGGILGMGESQTQRIELAMTLREIGVQSVPLNFLNPVKGTPMGTRTPMQPIEILQNIAVFRYMLPKADLRIAGGRVFLRDMQSMIFMAGASGVMIGDYLTTQGRDVQDDLRMLGDLNLRIRGQTQKQRAAKGLNAKPAFFTRQHRRSEARAC